MFPPTDDFAYRACDFERFDVKLFGMATRDRLETLKREWKAQFPDEDVSASLSLIALARATQLAQRNVASALAGAEIHPSGFEVLATLHRARDPHGMTLARLASLLGVTPASMTNRIDNLVSKGWVERKVSDVDRRIVFARLTKEGAKLVERLQPLVFAAESQQLKGLKKGDRKDLGKLLVRLVDSLEGAEPDEDES